MNYSEKIIESMDDTVIVVGSDGKIKMINKSAEKLLGYDKSELIGKPVGSVISEENLNFFSAIRDMVKSNSANHYNLSYITKNGRKIPINFCGSALKDQNGKLTGIVGVGRDMREIQKLINQLQETKTTLEEKVRERTTALKSAKEEVEEAYSKLKLTQAQLVQSEKLSAIGQLAAGIAHEINNPIGFINSNLGTLNGYTKDILSLLSKLEECLKLCENSEAPDTSGLLKELKDIYETKEIDFIMEDIQNLITESKDGAERVKKIVQDLKDFSRIDEAELKVADINQIIDKTLNMIYNELKYKTTVTKKYGEIPEIMCFPRHLSQAFMNIIINAVQAIEKRGEIKIETCSKNENILIEISDTGFGIPEENIPKLFDPFFTTKEVGKGTGLGLNITYNIIKQHHGEIGVKSKVGQGTMFRILIPLEGIKSDDRK